MPLLIFFTIDFDYLHRHAIATFCRRRRHRAVALISLMLILLTPALPRSGITLPRRDAYMPPTKENDYAMPRNSDAERKII